MFLFLTCLVHLTVQHHFSVVGGPENHRVGSFIYYLFAYLFCFISLEELNEQGRFLPPRASREVARSKHWRGRQSLSLHAVRVMCPRPRLPRYKMPHSKVLCCVVAYDSLTEPLGQREVPEPDPGGQNRGFPTA
jgi:hypothetical protein